MSTSSDIPLLELGVRVLVLIWRRVYIYVLNKVAFLKMSLYIVCVCVSNKVAFLDVFYYVLGDLSAIRFRHNAMEPSSHCAFQWWLPDIFVILC